MPSPTPDPGLRDQLVLELMFDGAALDTSGHGGSIIVHGTTLTADRFGRPAAACLFDGLDDYIVVAPPPRLNGTQLSISVWVRLDGADSDLDGWSNCLVCQDDGNDRDQSRRVFQLSINQRRIVWHRMTNVRDPTSRRPVTLGTWHHVVAAVDRGKHRLFVDGVLHDTTRHALRVHEEEPIYIGRKGTPERHFFACGAIDDLRVYNRALTSREIRALFHEGGFGETPTATERLAIAAGRLRTRLTATRGEARRLFEPALIPIVRALRALRRPSKALNTRRLRERGETLETLVFRDAVPADLPELAALHVKTWNATYPGVRRPPTYETRARQWQEAFAKADGTWFCLVIENRHHELIGFAKGICHADGSGDLNKIYLLSEYQRVGIGRRLVGYVARRFLSLGITRMRLWADAANPSCGFYLALGATNPRGDDGRIERSTFIWSDLQQLAASDGHEAMRQ